MEEEAKKADTVLADTVMKLAFTSKDADAILKRVKYFENKTMRNEVWRLNETGRKLVSKSPWDMILTRAVFKLQFKAQQWINPLFIYIISLFKIQKIPIPDLIFSIISSSRFDFSTIMPLLSVSPERKTPLKNKCWKLNYFFLYISCSSH